MEDLMMHAYDYAGQDIAGWIATEKLDGCRARWDGAALWSRSGKPVKASPAMLAELPPGFALDGELYAGPGTRQAVASAMRNGRWPPATRFMVFDAPAAPGDYLRRLHAAMTRVSSLVHVKIVAALRISGIEDARDMLRAIKRIGGEGVMLHQPDRPYLPDRVSYLLKLKYEDQLPCQRHNPIPQTPCAAPSSATASPAARPRA
jgi:DNA ligase-1